MALPPQKPILSPEKLGPKGDGICFSPRGTVYVERAAPKDRLKIKFFRDSTGMSRGEILEIIEPSPYRQTPTCPHYSQCGNCTLLHLKTDYYQHWKCETVSEALLKLSIQPDRWLNPLFLGGQNRRRVTFTLLKKRGKTTLGYYKRRSQELTEIQTCDIAHPRIMEFKKFLKPYLPFLSHEGEPLDIFVQLVGEKLDVVLRGPLGKSGRPDSAFNHLLKEIFEISPVARVTWKEENRIHTLFEKGPVEIKFGELKVKLPPGAFLQPTLEGEKALVDSVLGALPKIGKFADLFSGCGTFSGPMLQKGSVEAFEVDSAAVNSLSVASKEKPLKVYRKDLFTSPLSAPELSKFDAIVFDPPRAGCSDQAYQLARSRCRIVIGVSCNPATFARDAKILTRGGYRLKTMQVIDQFLGSHHVEMVGVFIKSK